jgi:hypothetical protein
LEILLKKMGDFAEEDRDRSVTGADPMPVLSTDRRGRRRRR